jgi:hypothetical protein
MMQVETDGFSFVFTDAIDAFVFYETDKTKATFHGLPMKGVDIVAEFTDAYVYVELKDYDDFLSYDVINAVTDEEKKTRQDSFRWLKNYLKYKYRDSYLFRHAEQKTDKPIHYICLLTFDNALNSRMQKALKQELPVGKPSKRWKQEIAKSCQVLNLDKWNANFPKWPVTRLVPTIPLAAPAGAQ